MKQTDFTPEEFCIFDKSPLESAYAETFVYAPSSREEDNLGHLYIVAEISSNKTKKENAEFLSKLVGVLKNEFYKNTIVTPISALRFALKRANRFLEEEKNLRISSANLKLKIIISALKENNLHFSRLGDAEAMILRANTLQHVVPASAQARSALSFENIVSGEVLGSDRIVFATSQIHKISEESIIQKLRERDLAEYLKNDSSGLKTLGLIALYPGYQKDPAARSEKKDLPPLIQKPEFKMPMLASKKFRIIGPIMKKIPRIRMAAVVVIFSISAITITTVAVKLRYDTAENKKNAETLVQEVSDLKDKIASLIELKNEAEANELLNTANEKISNLEKLGYFNTTRSELKSGLDEMSKSLKKVEEISNLSPVFSLENNSSGFDPEEISAGKNKIFAFGGNTLYKFDLNRMNGEFSKLENELKIISVLPKPESPEKSLIVSQKRIMDGDTVVWTKPENIAGTDMVEATIYNSAFYLLGDNSLIYKLPSEISSTTGISAGELYLWSDNKNPSNQGQISDFAVEGSIFALTGPFDPNGISKTIVEMVNGKRTNKADIAEGASKIFTSSSHKSVYALSPNEGIIIALDKNLAIKKRFSRQELKGAKSFFVNSQERIIYFLKGKTVYSFEI